MKKSFSKHTGNTLDGFTSLAPYQYLQPQDLTTFSGQSKGKSSWYNLGGKKKSLLEKHFVGRSIFSSKTSFD